MITEGSKQKFEGFTLVYQITGKWAIHDPNSGNVLHTASFEECLIWITELKEYMELPLETEKG